MVRWGGFVYIDMDMEKDMKVRWKDRFWFVWFGWMGGRQGEQFLAVLVENLDSQMFLKERWT